VDPSRENGHAFTGGGRGEKGGEEGGWGEEGSNKTVIIREGKR